MEKRLKEYLALMAVQTGAARSEEERRALREEMLVQIAFFQHERLVHLVVTMTFAILAVLAMAASMLSGSPWLLALCGAFLVLLVPYIRHYYILENGVQKLYTYYDRIEETRRHNP